MISPARPALRLEPLAAMMIFLKAKSAFSMGWSELEKITSVCDILTNGFANGLRLLVDFPQHVIGKLR